jgi:hypothetical protein
MTIGYALLLSTLTQSYFETAVAAIGYERASAETYKTFFFPSKPRGKFAGKPVLFPDVLFTRRYFVPVFITLDTAQRVRKTRRRCVRHPLLVQQKSASLQTSCVPVHLAWGRKQMTFGRQSRPSSCDANTARRGANNLGVGRKAAFEACMKLRAV